MISHEQSGTRYDPDARGHELLGRAVLVKPVLFLDIDGVLNEFGSQPEGGILRIQQDKVRRLKRILDTVPCDVVLSSTWRMIPTNREKVVQMLQKPLVMEEAA